MAVRENLFNFLEERKEQPDYEYYWIDQLCIDQSNVEEVNCQVGMMSDIYRRATSTLAWLGGGIALEEAAREFIRSEDRDALVTILNDQYFTRLWVVQEVMLARDVSILIRGNRSITWKEISKAVFSPRGFDRGYTLNNALEYILDKTSPSAAELICQRLSKPYKPVHSLYDTIKYFSDNGCHDPRDRVYGLLGIVKEHERVVVDYSNSVEEVYLSVLKVLSMRSVWEHRNPYLEPEDVHGVLFNLGKTMGLGRSQLTGLRFFLYKVLKLEPGRIPPHPAAISDNIANVGDVEDMWDPDSMCDIGDFGYERASEGENSEFSEQDAGTMTDRWWYDFRHRWRDDHEWTRCFHDCDDKGRIYSEPRTPHVSVPAALA